MVGLDLRTKAAAARPLVLGELGLGEPERLAAVATWKGRMVNEHISARVFAGLVPQMMRAGLDPDHQAAVALMIGDELRHARMCATAVLALGGDPRAELPPLAAVPDHEDADPLEAVLRNVLSISCLAETVAVALIDAERLVAGPPALAELLRSILADEVKHARFGWRLLEELRLGNIRPQPDVFVGIVGFDDLTVMNLERDGQPHPTLVVFQNLWICEQEAQLRFALGRTMMDLYPSHFCGVALDRKPQLLQQLLMACLHGMGLPAQGDVHALESISRAVMGRMRPDIHDLLRSRLEDLVAAGSSIDMKRWVAASELTAHRMGLLLAGDLQIAERRISREQVSLGLGPTMAPRDKLAELLCYSISDDYFSARRSLGVSVS